MLPQVFTCHTKKLDESYGQNDPLTFTKGKMHECLGVTIDFRTEGKCMFTQHDSIKKIGMTLPDDLRGVSKSTSDPVNAFKLDEQAEKLSKHKM